MVNTFRRALMGLQKNVAKPSWIEDIGPLQSVEIPTTSRHTRHWIAGILLAAMTSGMSLGHAGDVQEAYTLVKAKMPLSMQVIHDDREITHAFFSEKHDGSRSCVINLGGDSPYVRVLLAEKFSSASSRQAFKSFVARHEEGHCEFFAMEDDVLQWHAVESQGGAKHRSGDAQIQSEMRKVLSLMQAGLVSGDLSPLTKERAQNVAKILEQGGDRAVSYMLKQNVRMSMNQTLHTLLHEHFADAHAVLRVFQNHGKEAALKEIQVALTLRQWESDMTVRMHGDQHINDHDTRMMLKELQQRIERDEMILGDDPAEVMEHAYQVATSAFLRHAATASMLKDKEFMVALWDGYVKAKAQENTSNQAVLKSNVPSF